MERQIKQNLKILTLILMLFTLVTVTITSNDRGDEPLIVHSMTSLPTDPGEWRQNTNPLGPIAYYTNAVGSHVGMTSGLSFNLYGCFVVATSIQVARSGSDSRSDFNPVLFAKDMVRVGGVNNSGEFMYAGPKNIYGEDFQMVTALQDGNTTKIIDSPAPINLTDTSAEGVKQALLKFSYDEDLYIVLRGYNTGSSHYVALEKYEDGEVYINDPGSPAKTLTEAKEMGALVSYEQVVLFKGKNGFNKTLNQNGRLKPEKEEIREAVTIWDGENVPGLPKEYDASWEHDALPKGYVPDEQEYTNVDEWTFDYNYIKETNRFQTIRTAIAVAGLIMSLYAILLFIAGTFNNLFKGLNLVYYLTFKNLTFTTDTSLVQDNPKRQRMFRRQKQVGDYYVTFTDIIIISLSILVIATLLVSGILYKAIITLILLIMKLKDAIF